MEAGTNAYISTFALNSVVSGKSSGRLLRRQFSLDRADEQSTLTPDFNQRTPRIYKQNSAGAANDLERIEEVPTTARTSGTQNYRQSASISLSVESLTLR